MKKINSLINLVNNEKVDKNKKIVIYNKALEFDNFQEIIPYANFKPSSDLN